MRLLYTLSVYLYLFSIRVASLHNAKAKKWLRGREDLFSRISRDCKNETTITWFHCASLGEFEQGRPLIEEMKKRDPACRILLTFYSPSGYEIRKDYDKVDFVYYLPLDTPGNAVRFLDIVKPASVYIVKYEFWYNLLSEIGRRKIPAYLVSGIFRREQHFFKWYGSWFLKQLNCFTRFYVQDEASLKLLRGAGYENAVLSGDTRFDRVASIAAESKDLPLVKAFKQDKKLMIAGSAWEKDEALIETLSLKKMGYKLLLAPHEIGQDEIKATVARFEQKHKVICYSEANLTNVMEADVLIVDNVGMLSSLYRYGTLAFIGGGFGDGIHNILEASVWGLPVIFGPNYRKFSEAHELIDLGAAFCIRNEDELGTVFSKLNDPLLCRGAGEVARNYVQQKSGATNRILLDVESAEKTPTLPA